MDPLQQKVVDAVDEDFIVRTTMELVEIQSPTGFEEEAAKYVEERYREAGLETRLQQISEGGYNTVGMLPGSGNGFSVMFNGHLDTSYTGEESQLTADGYKNKAIRDGDWIIGNGSNNMKSADVCYLAATRALMEADVPLKGDIVLAAVAGEIERNPIDAYQGAPYDGYGAGTKHLITHGYLTDFCILGEPTALGVGTWAGGTVWFKITTAGPMGHICYGEYLPSAIERMEWVQAALREWRAEYTERNEFKGNHPLVNLAAVDGGWPYRCGRTSVECNLYVDVRMVPGQRVQDVHQEFRGLIRSLNAKDPSPGAKVESFCTIPPSAVPDDAHSVQSIKRAHETVVGEPPKPVQKTHYNDSDHMNRYGIEVVVYGPAGRMRSREFGWAPDLGEFVHIPDLVTASKVYALAALDLCTQDRDSKALRPDPFAAV